MKENSKEYFKIHHLFYSDVLEEDIVEKLWGIQIDKDKHHYKLDSIPFYAKSLALGDIIEARYDDEEKALVLEDIIEFSGHSTVQVVVLNDNYLTDNLRQLFHNLGCSTEKQIDRYFAIDIPSSIDYKLVKKELIKLQKQQIIDYGEACLSAFHND
jgi:hypothetical protein